MRCPTISELPSPATNKIGWPWTEGCPQYPNRTSDGKPWLKLSIITPSLNQGKYLEETIRSVLLQGYPNLEYIIIDGGSSDDSIEIIKKYEQWLSYWISQPDRGQASAINKGFKKATGDIIAWLNSDDVYIKEALKEVSSFFSQQPEIDFIYGGCVKISEDGAIISKDKSFPYSFKKLLMHNIIAQPSAYFRKKVVDELGPLNENLNLCFDVEMWIKCGLKFNLQNHPKFFSKFRFHQNSKTVSQHLLMMKESAEVTVRVFEKNAYKDDISRKILRLRYLNLAVLEWRTNKNYSKKIEYYVNKANINQDLFNVKFIPLILRVFLDLNPSDIKKMNKRKIKQYVLDIESFFMKYIHQYFPLTSKRNLSYLVSQCYFIISIKKKNPILFIQGAINNPIYSLLFVSNLFSKFFFEKNT